ncbi:hypothetical protein ACWNT8_06400 [Pigmentibacter ruber]
MFIDVLFIYFAAALLGGLVSTSPPGPLNIQLIILYLKKQKKNLFAFQSGIILTDAIVCFFAYLIADQTVHAEFILNFQKKHSIFLNIIFIIFILTLGFTFVINSRRNAVNLENNLSATDKIIVSETNLISSFFKGIVGTLTIPSLLPFWYLWWIGQDISDDYPVEYLILPIFLGVYIGDIAIFKLYRLLAYGLNKKFMQIKIHKIEAFVGYLLILSAAILLFKTMYF